MHVPEVSVTIPTYNRGDMVLDAINSVLNQTFTNFEIIVIDDGSTDGTQQKISEIQDERIKYYYKENGGVSSARNLGLCQAQGQYIALLDSDDIWPLNYLEKMINALDSCHEYSLAYCQFKNYYQDGTVKDGFKHSHSFSGWFTEQYYKTGLYFIPSCCVFRKEICKALWFDEVLKKHEDYDFFLRLSTKTQFLFVDNVHIRRRMTPGSLQRSGIDYNTPLVFERFYNQFCDKKLVSAGIAKRRISKEYRELAKKCNLRGNRKASISLYLRAIRRYPWENKNYKGLRKALFLSRKRDNLPNWQMPKPLPNYITVSKVNGASHA
jgi:glycosyltransferase involved in cell wall biosynthesis